MTDPRQLARLRKVRRAEGVHTAYHTGVCCGLTAGWYWGLIGERGATSAINGPHDTEQIARDRAWEEVDDGV